MTKEKKSKKGSETYDNGTQKLLPNAFKRKAKKREIEQFSANIFHEEIPLNSPTETKINFKKNVHLGQENTYSQTSDSEISNAIKIFFSIDENALDFLSNLSSCNQLEKKTMIAYFSDRKTQIEEDLEEKYKDLEQNFIASLNLPRNSKVLVNQYKNEFKNYVLDHVLLLISISDRDFYELYKETAKILASKEDKNTTLKAISFISINIDQGKFSKAQQTANTILQYTARFHGNGDLYRNLSEKIEGFIVKKYAQIEELSNLATSSPNYDDMPPPQSLKPEFVRNSYKSTSSRFFSSKQNKSSNDYTDPQNVIGIEDLDNLQPLEKSNSEDYPLLPESKAIFPQNESFQDAETYPILPISNAIFPHSESFKDSGKKKSSKESEANLDQNTNKFYVPVSFDMNDLKGIYCEVMLDKKKPKSARKGFEDNIEGYIKAIKGILPKELRSQFNKDSIKAENNEVCFDATLDVLLKCGDLTSTYNAKKSNLESNLQTSQPNPELTKVSFVTKFRNTNSNVR